MVPEATAPSLSNLTANLTCTHDSSFFQWGGNPTSISFTFKWNQNMTLSHGQFLLSSTASTPSKCPGCTSPSKVASQNKHSNNLQSPLPNLSPHHHLYAHIHANAFIHTHIHMGHIQTYRHAQLTCEHNAFTCRHTCTSHMQTHICTHSSGHTP